MRSARYDAIIVGAGQGGLACASLLARAGMKVLMLEKSRVVGGRYGSHPYRGFTLNNFSGLFFPQNLFRLLPRLGVEIPWTEVKMHCYFKTDSGEFYYHPMAKDVAANPELTFALYDWLGLDRAAAREFVRIVAEIRDYPVEKLQALRTTSVKDWAHCVTDNDKVRAVIWELIYEMTSLTISKWEDCSIYHSFIQWMPVMRGEVPIVQPRNAEVPGSMALPKKLLEVFLASGGELRTEHEVEKILVGGGRVSGVSAKGLADNSRVLLEADRVIGDLKVWQYFELGLLEEREFPSEWLADVRRLKQWQGAAVHIWWGSKRRIPRYHEILGDPDKGVRWLRLLEYDPVTGAYIKNVGGIGAHSLFDPSMAPPGKDLLAYGYWISTEQGAPWSDISAAFDMGMRQLRNLVEKGFGEDFDEVTEFVKKEYHSPTWSCENYSIYPRPDVVAPGVRGLYFVGDSVEGDGVGGDIATGTGMHCADLILAR
jgi:phytoene dehydrogenase-like protein